MEVNGLAQETEDHTHVAIYDPATGDGKTTESFGHKHAIEDFKIVKDSGNLHEHNLVRASNLDKEQTDMISSLLTTQDEEKK